MPVVHNNAFFNNWQKNVVIIIGILLVITVVFFILTDLGNVASNFWLTNVFVGTWCGLLVMIDAMALLIIGKFFVLHQTRNDPTSFSSGCCLRGPKAAFNVAIITSITLVACALAISFNGVFLAQPSTCIMTPSCTNNSVSTTLFSYNMSQNFFTVFTGLNGFRNYTLSQSKYLFQTVQISFSCLDFVLCLVYLTLYLIQRKKTSQQVTASDNEKHGAATIATLVQPLTKPDRKKTPHAVHPSPK